MFSIDLRETIISFRLLQIVSHFKQMRTGESIEILGIEESTIPDLESVLPEGKFKLIEVEPMDANGPYFQLKLKKTHTLNLQLKENCHVGSQPE